MEIIKQQYANGLRSLSVLSKDTQAVTIMFLVNVGSRYELANEWGLAHFVEHTLFKGTQKRPSSKAISMEMESLGGSSNAFTSYDYTGYYIKAPAGNFSQSFEILSDMFLNSQFQQKEVDRERGVIVEEIRMYEDRPTSKVAQEWLKNFYQGNNLGVDITGTIDSVNGMQRQQFFDFLKKHYYAENVLIVVSGNAEQKQIEELINNWCLKIPSKVDAASSFEEFNFVDTPERKRDIRIKKDVEQTHIVFGGMGIKREDPDRFALQVANSILSSGFGSRLFQVIRDELGLAYYVYSRLLSFSETGVFHVGMGVDSNRVDEALNAAKKELKAITEGDFTMEEFTRAKNYMLGNLVTELETSDDLASFYGMQELLQDEKLTVDQVKERIMGVSLEDISRASSRVFKEDNYYLAILSK